MPYSQFTLPKVIQDFNLNLIEGISLLSLPENTLKPSSYLEEFISKNLQLAVALVTEKARSELIICPLLLAVKEALNNQISAANKLLAVEDQRLQETDELRQQDLEAFEEQERAKQESAEARIKAVENAAKAASARINQAEADSINNILANQVSGNFDEATAAEKILEVEEGARRERIRQKRAEIDEIIQLEADGVLEVEKASIKKTELEAERTAIVRKQLEAQIQAQQQAEQNRREIAVKEFEKFNETS